MHKAFVIPAKAGSIYLQPFVNPDSEAGRRLGIAQTVSAQSTCEGKSQTLSDQLPLSESLKAKGGRESQAVDLEPGQVGIGKLAQGAFRMDRGVCNQ
jgi:hypothetical protein